MSSTPFIINAIREFIDKDLAPNKNNNDKQNLIKNSGCCGAASDAWVPSYPSSDSSSLKLDDDSLFSINKDDK